MHVLCKCQLRLLHEQNNREVMEIENLSDHEDDQENDHEPQAACNEATVALGNQETSAEASSENTHQAAAAISLISDPDQINDGVHPMVRPTRSSCDPEVVSRSPLGEDQRREGAICTSETQHRVSRTSETQDNLLTTELPQRQPHAQSSQSRGETRRSSVACPEEQREPEQLNEPPPPTYTSLFPARGSSSQSSPHTDTVHGRYYPPCSSQHSGLMASSTSFPMRHSTTAQSHAQCIQYGHRCSICYPTPTYPHNSPHQPHEHYTGLVSLPGSVGYHHHCTEAACNHRPRQIADHSTVLPMHHRHGVQERRESSSISNVIALSTVCVILCSLILNLPALLCVVPALAYSITAQKLNAEGRYRQAKKYSTKALACNFIAFGLHLAFLIVVCAIWLLAVFVFDAL